MNKDTVIRYFRDPPEIQTERLILRRMKKTDYHDMYEYASNPDVTKYLTWEIHPNAAYTLRYLAYVATRYRAGEFFDWAVVLRENNKMIGTCGFTRIDEENSILEIGYVINPKFWGMGIATEAAERIIEFAFEELNINRIEAKFMFGNESSVKIESKQNVGTTVTLRFSKML